MGLLFFISQESASGQKSIEKFYPFTFDRVFGPKSTQTEVFEEISQLVQSALDGYNVCIFAYGQTGSGKTFTMEGPPPPFTEESEGMIHRAVSKVFQCAETLKSKGWEYRFEGQFLEIYNETIRDLLDSSNSNKKHEISHLNGNGTVVSDVVIGKICYFSNFFFTCALLLCVVVCVSLCYLCLFSIRLIQIIL